MKGKWDDGTDKYIDFNKIVPMPDGLHFEPHSGITGAAEQIMSVPLHSNPLIAGLEKSNRLRDVDRVREFDDKEWAMFIQCLNNIRDYGHSSWYTWAVEHWGTKWNAYSQSMKGQKIIFQTAWNGVLNLIKEISQKYPDCVFDYRYADEDTGSNCASYRVCNGDVIEEFKPKSQSNEAYELAFLVNPDDRQYYKKINGKYEYFDEAL